MKKPIYVGVDWSIASPAICVFDSSKCSEFKFRNCEFFYASKDKKKVEDEKNIHGVLIPKNDSPTRTFRWVAEWALDVIPAKALLALEGYSYGKAGQGRVFDIAESTGKFKDTMIDHVMMKIVEPTVIKKFVTGIPMASKKEMHDGLENVDPEGIKILAQVFDYRVRSKIEKKVLKNGQVRVRDKGVIDSPISDLIDSYFICKFIM